MTKHRPLVLSFIYNYVERIHPYLSVLCDSAHNEIEIVTNDMDCIQCDILNVGSRFSI